MKQFLRLWGSYGFKRTQPEYLLCLQSLLKMLYILTGYVAPMLRKGTYTSTLPVLYQYFTCTLPVLEIRSSFLRTFFSLFSAISRAVCGVDSSRIREIPAYRPHTAGVRPARWESTGRGKAGEGMPCLRRVGTAPCSSPPSLTLPSLPIRIYPAYTSVKTPKSGALAKVMRLYSGRTGHTEGSGKAYGPGWGRAGDRFGSASDLSANSELARFGLVLIRPNQGTTKLRSHPQEYTVRGRDVVRPLGEVKDIEESCVCTHAKAPARSGLGLALGLVVLLFLTTTYLEVLAQTPDAQSGATERVVKSVKLLKVGDTVPNIRLSGIRNFKTDEAKLSDFAGKLIIIDFWSTWCTTCISSFPKLEHIQREFDDQVQIVLVNTSEDDEQVAARFDILKKRGSDSKLPDLPYINGVSILREFFPYRAVPHHVWLDSNLVVRAITNGYNTNFANIEKFLNGQSLTLAVKHEVKDFDPLAPLWSEGNGRYQEYIRSYSYTVPYISGIRGHTVIRHDSTSGKVLNVRLTNRPLLDLYKVAFGNSAELWASNPFRTDNRIILQVDDPSRWQRPIDKSLLDKWLQHNAFSYEVHLPAHTEANAFEVMRQDLADYFGYHARVEEREILCWVLKKLPDTRSTYIDSTGGKKSWLRLAQVSKDKLAAYFTRRYQSITEPFIVDLYDDVGFSLHVDSEVDDPAKLVEQLMGQGFDLQKEIRRLKMLVISN